MIDKRRREEKRRETRRGRKEKTEKDGMRDERSHVFCS